MKDLSKLGFTYDKEMDMFVARTIKQFKELINEDISFCYVDSDNGFISGRGKIVAIDDSQLDRDGEGYLYVDFKKESGHSLDLVIYRKDSVFLDGEKFMGGIFAGDDLDDVLFKINESAN
ncbi:MAG: hypothetical protein ACOYCB_07725 [Fastidiosipilaceae bacterium]|jgi:uncharacterized pyridoxamine 5'-phosphate oxidase family protein